MFHPCQLQQCHFHNTFYVPSIILLYPHRPFLLQKTPSCAVILSPLQKSPPLLHCSWSRVCYICSPISRPLMGGRMGHLHFKHLFSTGRRSRRNYSSSHNGHESFSSRAADPSQENIISTQKPTWKCFSYEEIYTATNGFHQDNLVGRGGCAEVYKGVLQNGQVIAVKRLMAASADEQKEKEFLTELGTISHVHHPNVCALLGCCIDRDLHLIFEFSSHGSVSSHLHDESLPPMAWKLRHKIALGTASGLHYLHKECKRRIIHRDIKGSNILLTADFEPQISDFGLAKWLPKDCIHRAVAQIEGTLGYLAPEYFKHGIVDEKTDVFAFGVFLLELISGKKPVDGCHQSLLAWAKPHLNHGTIEKLVDPRLGEDYDFQQLNKLVFTASLCIRGAAQCRPSMSEVLELVRNGEVMRDCWKMPEEEDDDEELWGFDDLYDLDTPFSSMSSTSTLSHPSLNDL